MEHKRSEVVEIINERVYKYTCDFCAKDEICNNELPESWYSITTGHSSWGNDSIISIEIYHLCSFKCFLNKIVNDENKNYSGFFIKIDDLNIENILDIEKYIERIGD